MSDNNGKITEEDLRSILDEFDAQIEQDMQEICSFAEASDTESEAEAELDFETDDHVTPPSVNAVRSTVYRLFVLVPSYAGSTLLQPLGTVPDAT